MPPSQTTPAPSLTLAQRRFLARRTFHRITTLNLHLPALRQRLGISEKKLLQFLTTLPALPQPFEAELEKHLLAPPGWLRGQAAQEDYARHGMRARQKGMKWPMRKTPADMNREETLQLLAKPQRRFGKYTASQIMDEPVAKGLSVRDGAYFMEYGELPYWLVARACLERTTAIPDPIARFGKAKYMGSRGSKARLDEGRRVNVYLDSKSERAALLFGPTLSEGIRKSLDIARAYYMGDSDTPPSDALIQYGTMPISQLAITARAATCLIVAGLRTIADVALRTSGQLYGVPNLGRKGVAEVERALAELGVRHTQKADR